MSAERLIEGAVRYSRELAAEIQPVFTDREQAGKQLAAVLSKRQFPNPVLFAIPKGGVPVALPIQRELTSSLHFLLAAKIPVADDERFGFGAVTQQGTFINTDLTEMFSMDEQNPLLHRGIQRAKEALVENEGLIRNDQFPPNFRGATAIIIDDGISTGYTTEAAASLLVPLEPSRIVIAAPIASRQGFDHLRSLGLETVAVHVSEGPGFLVDSFYQSFPDLSVKEVQAMIEAEEM